jgi:hypothetical protein
MRGNQYAIGLLGGSQVVGDLITITTTLTGDFSINLDGVGTCVITWPDLSTSEVVMTGAGAVTTTKALVGGGSITISNPSVITWIDALGSMSTGGDGNKITSISGLQYCLGIKHILFSGNLLTSFDTYSAWTNLEFFALASNQLTTINLYASWTKLKTLWLYNNSLTSVGTFAAWVDLESFEISYNQLSSVDVFAAWTKIQILNFGHNLLTSLNTYAAWTVIAEFSINNNQLTSLTTHAEWVVLEYFDVTDNSITSLTYHSEWVSLGTGGDGFYASGCALTETTVNNILINALASGITSGAINLTGGTNAAPTGAGITAADTLNAAGVIVTANGYTYGE